MDDLKDRRGYSHLEEEALDRTMWRNHFEGGFELVVRQNTEWMNIYLTQTSLRIQETGKAKLQVEADFYC